ncbi:small ubiquitin-related modifier-like [Rhodnius prolixus]|uniref:small ubiquitin-related modifier-like n=1 Tax=Rhodnius prolixus TaxID=13249 RepID=UPI003D18D7B3
MKDLKGKPKMIRLMVLSEQYAIVKFRVKTKVKMRTLMRSYIRLAGIQSEKHRISFMYDGVKVNKEDTPESLELPDEAIIEVYRRMSGAGIPNFCAGKKLIGNIVIMKVSEVLLFLVENILVNNSPCSIERRQHSS